MAQRPEETFLQNLLKMHTHTAGSEGRRLAGPARDQGLLTGNCSATCHEPLTPRLVPAELSRPCSGLLRGDVANTNLGGTPFGVKLTNGDHLTKIIVDSFDII